MTGTANIYDLSDKLLYSKMAEALGFKDPEKKRIVIGVMQQNCGELKGFPELENMTWGSLFESLTNHASSNEVAGLMYLVLANYTYHAVGNKDLDSLNTEETKEAISRFLNTRFNQDFLREKICSDYPDKDFLGLGDTAKIMVTGQPPTSAKKVVSEEYADAFQKMLVEVGHKYAHRVNQVDLDRERQAQGKGGHG